MDAIKILNMRKFLGYNIKTNNFKKIFKIHKEKLVETRFSIAYAKFVI